MNREDIEKRIAELDLNMQTLHAQITNLTAQANATAGARQELALILNSMKTENPDLPPAA